MPRQATFHSPLTLLGVIAVAGIVGVIGYILFMIAMHNLSKYYGEPAIFKNLLKALILSIGGSVVLGVVLVAFFVSSIVGNFASTTSPPLISGIWVLAGLGVLLLGILAIAIYSAVLTKRAFRQARRQIRSGQFQNSRAASFDRGLCTLRSLRWMDFCRHRI